jgi:hypothetical protein
MKRFLKKLLSKKQLSRLASNCADVAQVSLATIAIPFAFDKAEPLGVILGMNQLIIFYLILAVLALAVSIMTYAILKYGSKANKS